MGRGRYVRCRRCKKQRKEVGDSKLCRACYDATHEQMTGYRVGSWDDPEVQRHHRKLCQVYGFEL